MPITFTCGNCGTEVDATDKTDNDLDTVTCPECGEDIGEIGTDDGGNLNFSV